MTTSGNQKVPRSMQALLQRMLRSLIKSINSLPVAISATVGSLAAISAVYLGYDVVKASVTPCEQIFQQTHVGLNTKISVLQAEGEIQLGRDTVSELSERAQMVALNLKTCCTVLDAGRLNPEEFLQCKSKARQYEAKVNNVVALVAETSPTETASVAPAAAAAAKAAGNMPAPAAAAAAAPPPSLKKAVNDAREVSRQFNDKVMVVQKEQALRSLESQPASNVEVSSAEHEPNNDLLNVNVLPLDTWIRSAINPVKDNDFFTFTTPPNFRDWIRIEVKNESTTLEPGIQLFDAKKSSIGTNQNKTQGGDATYDFVSGPDARYIVRIGSYYQSNTGVYLIRAAAQKAYDAHEPNEDILQAKDMPVGTAIEAKIMDKHDADVFRFEGVAEKDVTITIQNKSTKLHPHIALYNGSKSNIGNASNKTPGGDLSHTIKSNSDVLYVRVADHYTSHAGEYVLKVEAK